MSTRHTPPPATRRARATVLRYDQRDNAPRVVAKGYGAMADTLIRTAREHGVPVHESPELVELLMRVDMDAEIPPALYLAVAELLAWLYQLDANAALAEPQGTEVQTKEVQAKNIRAQDVRTTDAPTTDVQINFPHALNPGGQQP
ncbi:Flagellar related protein [Kerstersia similis]